MEYMRLAGAILVAVLSALVFVWFNRRSLRRFGYGFFSLTNFSRLSIAVALLFAGGLITVKHTPVSDDIGLLLLLAGGGVLWWSLFDNFRRTNVVFGVVGTALQLGLFLTFFVSGLFILMIVAGIGYVVLSAVQPVYVVNRGDVKK